MAQCLSRHGTVQFARPTFLDRTVSRMFELGPGPHQVREYACTNADYLTAKQAERERQLQAYTDQQAEIAHLRDTARHLRGIARFK